MCESSGVKDFRMDDLTKKINQKTDPSSFRLIQKEFNREGETGQREGAGQRKNYTNGSQMLPNLKVQDKTFAKPLGVLPNILSRSGVKVINCIYGKQAILQGPLVGAQKLC